MKLMLTAAAAASAAAVAIAGTASGQNGATTLKVTATTSHFGFVDAPPKQGPSKPGTRGDVFVLQGPVAQGGAVHLDCTVTVPGKHGVNLCHAVIALGKGTISVEGLVHDATNSDDFSVTGGTGAYAGASGTMHSQSLGHNRDALTFKLM